jgi:energy-coupling factor transport system ATP-binding protein
MQYPEYQLFEETVEADIAYGPRNMGLDEEEIRKRVLESADFVGLDRANLSKSPFDLSGGQKRRAAIAGIMAMRPEVLVLDEPSAGLDPAGKSSIFEGIRNYAHATGAAVIIVSHSMDDISTLATRLIVMSKGELAMTGTPREVFKNRELLASIGLGVPQAAELAYQLREAGYDLPDDLYTSDELYSAILKLAGKEEGVC